MLKYELLPQEKALVLYPEEPLRSEDFEAVSRAVDDFLKEHEHSELQGLLIEAESFPGWEDLSGFMSHMSFIKDHHNKIRKVAAVTDSRAIPALQSIGQHFVNPDIEQFSPEEKSKALNWIVQ